MVVVVVVVPCTIVDTTFILNIQHEEGRTDLFFTIQSQYILGTVSQWKDHSTFHHGNPKGQKMVNILYYCIILKIYYRSFRSMNVK